MFCFVRLSVVGSGAEGDLSVDCFVCLFCFVRLSVVGSGAEGDLSGDCFVCFVLLGCLLLVLELKVT